MADRELLLMDLVAAGISLAIDNYLSNYEWELEDMIHNTCVGETVDCTVLINEVATRMTDYSTHLQANYCDDILSAWEIINDDKDRSTDKGQGNPGEPGERHDADTAQTNIVKEIAQGIKAIKAGN